MEIAISLATLPEHSKRFTLAKEIPKLIDIGIDIFKIQGREYPTDLVASITKVFREILNKSTKNKNPELGGEIERLNTLMKELDRRRMIYTGNLREKLYEKLGIKYYL
ncbi:MAG: U32 family peptidase [Archaeoglobaceae archaeon]